MLISLATTTVGKRAIATCVIGGACYVAVCEIGKRFASYNKRKEAREIVLETVKQNGMALEYASANLKGDRDVVIEAVKQDGWALKFASADLKADREIVLEAVKQYWRVLDYASADLKADREIVLETVKQNGEALRYASRELRDGGLKNFIKEQLTIFNQFNTFLLGQFKSSNTKTLDPPSGTNYLFLLGSLDQCTHQAINTSIAKCLGSQGYNLISLKVAAENLSISI